MHPSSWLPTRELQPNWSRRLDAVRPGLRRQARDLRDADRRSHLLFGDRGRPAGGALRGAAPRAQASAAPVLMRADDLREWIALLEREEELVRVDAEVDPHLEVTEIVARTIRTDGPALLFEH